MTPIERRKVLVLNKNWQPLRVATLIRGLTLVFGTYANGQPKARIIDAGGDFGMYNWSDWSKLCPAQGEEFISASDGSRFRAPKVIVLTHYDRYYPKSSKFNRRSIYKRDEGRCQYCNRKLKSDEWTMDHVLPQSRGGKTTWENIVLACVECNSQKANRLPHEAVRGNRRGWVGPSPMRLIREPFKPDVHALCAGIEGPPPREWEGFISQVYWGTELVNDNPPEASTTAERVDTVTA